MSSETALPAGVAGPKPKRRLEQLFHIELKDAGEEAKFGKEAIALIIFSSPQITYTVSVADPIDFSSDIYKIILKHYLKVGDKQRYNRLLLEGFDYRKYVR